MATATKPAKAATPAKAKPAAAKPAAAKPKFKIFYKLYHKEYGKDVINYMGNHVVLQADTKKAAQDDFVKLVGKQKYKIEGVEDAPKNSKVDTKLW